jgi:glycolate oxidase subunit GlcD
MGTAVGGSSPHRSRGARAPAAARGPEVAGPSRSQLLLEELERIVGPRYLLRGRAELLPYATDANRMFRGMPLCVVCPADTAQVAAVVAACHRAGVGFVPRGAGTGLSGGATPGEGEVVVSLARLRRIRAVDPVGRTAVVEAGVVNAHLSRYVAHLGLYYAPDPSSQTACTIGGNIAENSGGAHCLKYGVTTNHVLGLEVVLPDGEVLYTGVLGPRCYGYDLTGLFCGAEGTLGIVTAACVRLLPRPAAVRTALALFRRVEDAALAVERITAAGAVPAALEMMDRNAMTAVERGAYPVGYPEHIGAVLLIEFDGLEAGLDEQVEAAMGICREAGVAEVRAARDEAERVLWWNNRKAAFAAMGQMARAYYVADGVIPRTQLVRVLGQIAEISAEAGLWTANVFHAGDGNLHPLIAYDPTVPGEGERVMAAGSAMLAACVAAGGAVSGEHGIGLEKRDELYYCFDEVDLAVQREVHDVFDPEDRANPGKMFPLPGRCAEVRRALWDPKARLAGW